MMTQSQSIIEKDLSQFAPRLELNELVFEVNKIYHSLEASTYDIQHNEIFDVLPSIWKTMCSVADDRLDPDRKLRVLDFGSGTGFESAQVLENFGPERIESLVCYDPSVEMLEKCKARLTGRGVNIDYHSELSFLDRSSHEFDLLITNSVLHHLVDPLAVIKNLLRHMASNSCWIAGHEPSVRYWKNPECRNLYADYLKSRKFKRFFDRRSLAGWITRKLSPGSGILNQVADKAYAAGIFEMKPSPYMIRRLVDFHVGHDTGETSGIAGFDFQEMSRELHPDMEIVWRTSYNFLGDVAEVNVKDKRILAMTEALRTKFPDDGANFSSVWHRVSKS